MANILVIAGSVYGGAQYAAELAVEALQKKGHTAHMTETPTVDDVKSADNDVILLISSTTGAGDLPDNIVGFYSQLKEQFPLLPNKRYGVIALGDSSYGDTFCGGGRQLDELFGELQAVKVGERLEIDACETLQPEDVALDWVEGWSAKL